MPLAFLGAIKSFALSYAHCPDAHGALRSSLGTPFASTLFGGLKRKERALMPDVCIYGKAACTETQQVRTHLDLLGIPYRYVELCQDRSAQEYVRAHTRGELLTPTVRINGRFLIAPGEGELERELRGAGVMK